MQGSVCRAPFCFWVNTDSEEVSRNNSVLVASGVYWVFCQRNDVLLLLCLWSVTLMMQTWALTFGKIYSDFAWMENFHRAFFLSTFRFASEIGRQNPSRLLFNLANRGGFLLVLGASVSNFNTFIHVDLYRVQCATLFALLWTFMKHGVNWYWKVYVNSANATLSDVVTRTSVLCSTL